MCLGRQDRASPDAGHGANGPCSNSQLSVSMGHVETGALCTLEVGKEKLVANAPRPRVAGVSLRVSWKTIADSSARQCSEMVPAGRSRGGSQAPLVLWGAVPCGAPAGEGRTPPNLAQSMLGSPQGRLWGPASCCWAWPLALSLNGLSRQVGTGSAGPTGSTWTPFV